MRNDIDGFIQLRNIFQEKNSFIEDLKQSTVSELIEQDLPSLLEHLRYSLYVSLPTIRSATFDELAGSGQLAIIQDQDLRAALANYYAEYSLISGIVAQPIGDYKRLVYESFPGVVTYSWRTSGSTSEKNQIETGFEKLLSHPMLEASANAEIGYSGDLVFHCDTFIQLGEGLLTLIAANSGSN